MIRFYFHPSPNLLKVALVLEEASLPYEVLPVDTAKGEQHAPEFRAINPNGKTPAMVDIEGPAGTEACVFDSSAILLYLGDKTRRFIGGDPSIGRTPVLALLHRDRTGPLLGAGGAFPACRPEKVPYAIKRPRPCGDAGAPPIGLVAILLICPCAGSDFRFARGC